MVPGIGLGTEPGIAPGAVLDAATPWHAGSTGLAKAHGFSLLDISIAGAGGTY